MKQDLTQRQQEVLNIVEQYIADNGYPPSLRDIAARLGVNGTLGVMKHLNVLEKKGFIRRESGSRAIVLAHSTSAILLPIVGTVRAGALQPAVEEIEGYFAVDRSSLPAPNCFFLRVKGDSMIDAAILDRDLALVRPQQTAQNREIVVAMVEGEATLKRFFKERGRIRLQPENPHMEPIIVKEGDRDVTVVGKVIGIYRQMD